MPYFTEEEMQFDSAPTSGTFLTPEEVEGKAPPAKPVGVVRELAQNRIKDVTSGKFMDTLVEDVKTGVGAAEAGLNLATEFITWAPKNVVAGLKGIYRWAQTGSVDKASEQIITELESLSKDSAGTYTPKTAAGKAIQGQIASVLAAAPEYAGSKAYEKTGSAAAAAATEIAAQLLEFALIFKTAGIAKSKLVGKTPKPLTMQEKVAVRKMVDAGAANPAIRNLFSAPEWRSFTQVAKEVPKPAMKALPATIDYPATGPALRVTPSGKVVPPEFDSVLKTMRDRAYTPAPPEQPLTRLGAGAEKGTLPAGKPLVTPPIGKGLPKDHLKAALDKPGFERTAEELVALRSAERQPNKLVDQFGRPAKADLPNRLAEAVGKPDEVEVLTRGGVSSEKAQVEAIIADAVGQKVSGAIDLHKRAVAKGKPELDAMALKMAKGAHENGDKLVAASSGDKAVAASVERLERDLAGALKDYSAVADAVITAHNTSGGSSILRDGSNLYGQPGYSVAVFKATERVVDRPNLTAADIAAYAKEHSKYLEAYPDAFIGTWVDSGKSYLDISRHISDRAEALALAAKHQQKVIFDLGKGESVYLDSGETPSIAAINASGESAASLEAISRGKTMKFYAADERTGKIRPLIGVDAVDVSPKPYEVKLSVNQTGAITVLDSGAKVTGLTNDILVNRLKDVIKNERGSVTVDLGALRARAKRVFQAWKEFWLPFATMSEGERYKFERSKLRGDLGRAEDIVLRVSERINSIKDLEARKDIFRAIQGQPVSALPPEAAKLVRTIQAQENFIGRALVRRGIISEETYQAHKGKYVPYLIGKYLEERSGLKPTAGLELGYEKARNPNLTYEDRLTMGLIEDAGVAVPFGMGKALTDIKKWDFYDKIAANPQWVLPDTFISVAGKNWRIVDLAKELEVYRSLVKHVDEPKVKARLGELEQAMATAKAAVPSIPEGWSQMPNEPQYGPLAGKVIRKHIYDDLMPLYSSVAMQNKSKFVKTFWQIENEGMALWKASKVAWNLPTVSRNVISNIVQINMYGEPLYAVPGGIVNSLQQMKRNALEYRQARRAGLFRTSWAVEEINGVLAEMAKVEPGNWGSFLSVVGKISKYYGKIDDIAKLTVYNIARRNGKSFEEAILDAQKWGMDYSLAPRSVKEIRRHAIPFLSYSYKVAPLVAESLRERPWVIGKYIALPIVATELVAPALNDISQEEWVRLKKKMPEYIRRTKSALILPYKNERGHWQWVDMEYFFPWGNWVGMLREVKWGNYAAAYNKFGIGNHPLVDLHVVLRSAGPDGVPKDPFSGKDIYGKLDSPPEQYTKLMEWLYTKWAPQMFTRNGALGHTIQAVAGTKDKWGREETTTRALARWIGININEIEPKQEQLSRSAKIRALQEEFNRIKKDKSLTSGEKRAAAKRMHEQIRKIRRGED